MIEEKFKRTFSKKPKNSIFFFYCGKAAITHSKARKAAAFAGNERIIHGTKPRPKECIPFFIFNK